MRKIILTLIACIVSFNVMAYEMSCEQVKGEIVTYHWIYRCENSEVVCYIYDGAGMQCKFKEIKPNRTTVNIKPKQ